MNTKKLEAAIYLTNEFIDENICEMDRFEAQLIYGCLKRLVNLIMSFKWMFNISFLEKFDINNKDEESPRFIAESGARSPTCLAPGPAAIDRR